MGEGGGFEIQKGAERKGGRKDVFFVCLEMISACVSGGGEEGRKWNGGKEEGSKQGGRRESEVIKI